MEEEEKKDSFFLTVVSRDMFNNILWKKQFIIWLVCIRIVIVVCYLLDTLQNYYKSTKYQWLLHSSLWKRLAIIILLDFE